MENRIPHCFARSPLCHRNNQQNINVGDVVQIHYDCPRSQWKLAVIEDLTYGGDGYIWSVTVRTANGRTNRPVARLYPLEVSAEECSSDVNVEGLQHGSVKNKGDSDKSDINGDVLSQRRPTRAAMIKARRKVAEWTNILSRPREDDENDD